MSQIHQQRMGISRAELAAMFPWGVEHIEGRGDEPAGTVIQERHNSWNTRIGARLSMAPVAYMA